MTINEKLKELRLSAGLSQRDLGRKLGVKPQTISFWEIKDIPTKERMKQLSEVLGFEFESINAYKINDLIFKI